MLFKKCYDRISPQDVKTMMESNRDALFIDVREKDEYSAGHIPGSVNIPLGNLQTMKNKLPQDSRRP